MKVIKASAISLAVTVLGGVTVALINACFHIGASHFPAVSSGSSNISRPPAATGKRMVIDLVAKEDCWVKLSRASDGSQIYSGVVVAGTLMTWTESKAVTVLLGNPSGVSLIVNDKLQTVRAAFPRSLSLSPQSPN